MVHSPWEANWFAASQEIPRISRNPKVHYRTHKRPPPVCIVDQPNPVHVPTSHLLEIHPNIIHPSTSGSPQWSPSLRLPINSPASKHIFTVTAFWLCCEQKHCHSWVRGQMKDNFLFSQHHKNPAQYWHTSSWMLHFCFYPDPGRNKIPVALQYRRSDKSLARPGRKQFGKHIRDARDFNNIETRAVIKFFFSARQGAEGNSRRSDRNISFFLSWSV